jgi:hypothetical protein
MYKLVQVQDNIVNSYENTAQKIVNNVSDVDGKTKIDSGKIATIIGLIGASLLVFKNKLGESESLIRSVENDLSNVMAEVNELLDNGIKVKDDDDLSEKLALQLVYVEPFAESREACQIAADKVYQKSGATKDLRGSYVKDMNGRSFYVYD